MFHLCSRWEKRSRLLVTEMFVLPLTILSWWVAAHNGVIMKIISVHSIDSTNRRFNCQFLLSCRVLWITRIRFWDARLPRPWGEWRRSLTSPRMWHRLPKVFSRRSKHHVTQSHAQVIRSRWVVFTVTLGEWALVNIHRPVLVSCWLWLKICRHLLSR